LNSKLRSHALKARRSMSFDERRVASKIINHKVISSREFHAARSVGCYLPMHDEVDPSEIIARAWRANKRVFCPVMEKRGNMVYRFLGKDTTLLRNSFGLWEPFDSEIISARQLDLVVTPLVAFDKNNHRIGMGGGYFDRCFSYLRHRRSWRSPKLLGVAFACQEVDKIDPNAWDIPLYGVCSETN